MTEPYRYILHRSWLGSGDERRALWIMLNPSTADEFNDDPTIRKCVGFSTRAGVGGLVVVNLYGLRATKPKHLWEAADPVGPQNDRQIEYALMTAYAHRWPVIAAWGANARMDRVQFVSGLAAGLGVELLSLGVELLSLGVTNGGQPRHPLMVAYSTPLQRWVQPTTEGV